MFTTFIFQNITNKQYKNLKRMAFIYIEPHLNHNSTNFALLVAESIHVLHSSGIVR